jgi:ubiquinone/menaquinone biosynthesis C-methylase UbiE
MDFIKEYWEQNAKTWGTSHTASWDDLYAIRLEIRAIGARLRDGESVLDAGCGNGFALWEQCSTHQLARATGVDFSDNMIEAARRRFGEAKVSCSVELRVGDLRSLPFASSSFDTVWTTRALINLPNAADQRVALGECLRVAKPGGRVLLSEAFWEPLCRLNALRAVAGLPALVEHDYNRYLKKSMLEQYLSSQNIGFEVDDFSSLYYLGTRFVRDLVVPNIGSAPDYSGEINEDFYQMELRYSGGGLGIQQLYILQK